MSVWLERFVLTVLAAALGSTVIANPLRLDKIQQTTLIIAILALSLFAARTVERMRERVSGDGGTDGRAATGHPGEEVQTESPSTLPAPRLPEEAARTAISRELAAGNIAAAIHHWEGLTLDPARAEECEHIFAYCLKNPSVDDALNRAIPLANACWDGTVREEKLEALALARLKLS